MHELRWTESQGWEYRRFCTQLPLVTEKLGNIVLCLGIQVDVIRDIVRSDVDEELGEVRLVS